MTDAFLKVDLLNRDLVNGDDHVKGTALFPVSERLVITKENFTIGRVFDRKKGGLHNPGYEETQGTFLTVDGQKDKYEVVQDFETLKSTLTQAGFKIIEPPAPEGVRTLKVEGMKP